MVLYKFGWQQKYFQNKKSLIIFSTSASKEENAKTEAD